MYSAKFARTVTPGMGVLALSSITSAENFAVSAYDEFTAAKKTTILAPLTFTSFPFLDFLEEFVDIIECNILEV